jgi:hypothetical protein
VRDRSDQRIPKLMKKEREMFRRREQASLKGCKVQRSEPKEERYSPMDEIA